MFAHMVAKSGVWAHLPARAYWALTAVWSARIVVQSAPLVAHGGYGPPGGVGTLSWVGVGHGVAFGRVFGAVGGVRGVKVGQGGYGGSGTNPRHAGAVEPTFILIWWVQPVRNLHPYGPIRSK